MKRSNMERERERERGFQCESGQDGKYGKYGVVERFRKKKEVSYAVCSTKGLTITFFSLKQEAKEANGERNPPSRRVRRVPRD